MDENPKTVQELKVFIEKAKLDILGNLKISELKKNALIEVFNQINDILKRDTIEVMDNVLIHILINRIYTIQATPEKVDFPKGCTTSRHDEEK
jgi:hypothetical protein